MKTSGKPVGGAPHVSDVGMAQWSPATLSIVQI